MLAKIGKTSWQAAENMEFLCSKNEQRPIFLCDICHESGQRLENPPEKIDFLRTDAA